MPATVILKIDLKFQLLDKHKMTVLKKVECNFIFILLESELESGSGFSGRVQVRSLSVRTLCI